MISLRTLASVLTLAALLGLAPAAHAQQRKATPVAPAATARKPADTHGAAVVESLSGLDLVPNRRTGTFGIRVNHRLTQPATLRLIDMQTSRYIKNELLEPSPARTRAVQVGRLASGEYKMEIVLPDTVYWKTVRVSR